MKRKFWIINILIVFLFLLTNTILYLFFDLYRSASIIVVLTIAAIILSILSQWNYRKHYKHTTRQ